MKRYPELLRIVLDTERQSKNEVIKWCPKDPSIIGVLFKLREKGVEKVCKGNGKGIGQKKVTCCGGRCINRSEE